MRFDGDLVGHGAGWHEQGGFLAEQLGDALFQTIHRGVVVKDIVADNGGVHGRTHGRRRPGHSIASHIDQ